MLTVCMSIPSCRLTMIFSTPASRYFHLQSIKSAAPDLAEAVHRRGTRITHVASRSSRLGTGGIVTVLVATDMLGDLVAKAFEAGGFVACDFGSIR